MRATTLFLASAAVLAVGTQAQIKGQIAALDSSDSYCFFLPPMVGGDIALNEDRAIAFCNKPNARAPGAKIFPPGFVLTAHWATGKDWVQITGQIDPVQYSLSPCDLGGQYDIRAPVGATCAGFKHFVNVIEPETGVYGMRCCQEKLDCDVNHSEYGVRRIYGDYNFSGPRPDGQMPLADKCVNGKLPAGIAVPGPSSGGAAVTTGSGAASASVTGTATATGATSAATSGAASTTSSASTSQQTGDAKTEANKVTTSAASGKSVLMAGTAVLAAAVGLIMA
ncbi:hypothetical protein BGZ76_009397 [Entomortierella beljakovae]|nr:hypothetical protein BGZ76_009397 [Entomortierella beljakovae]